MRLAKQVQTSTFSARSVPDYYSIRQSVSSSQRKAHSFRFFGVQSVSLTSKWHQSSTKSNMEPSVHSTPWSVLFLF